MWERNQVIVSWLRPMRFVCEGIRVCTCVTPLSVRPSLLLSCSFHLSGAVILHHSLIFVHILHVECFCHVCICVVRWLCDDEFFVRLMLMLSLSLWLLLLLLFVMDDWVYSIYHIVLYLCTHMLTHLHTNASFHFILAADFVWSGNIFVYDWESICTMCVSVSMYVVMLICMCVYFLHCILIKLWLPGKTERIEDSRTRAH